MSVISPGGTTRRTRAGRPASRVKPNDGGQVKGGKRKPKPKAPTTRLLTASDILATDHPLNRAFVGWLLEKSTKLELSDPLPVTQRQARRFLQAYPQYRDIEVPLKKAA